MMKPKKRTSASSLVQELWHLFGYVSTPRKRQLGVLLILMLISSFSEVVSLGAVLPFLGALSNAERLLRDARLESWLKMFQIETSLELVTALALTFITAVIVTNGLRILTISMQTHLAASISSDLSCQLYEHTLLQPYSFHVRHNSSNLIQSVTEDTRKLTMNILIPLLALITNFLVAVSLSIGFFFIDSKIAVTASVVLGSAYISLYLLRRNLLEKNSETIVKTNTKQIQIVQESLGSIRDVLLGRAQDIFRKSYKLEDYPYRQAIASNTVISQSPRYIIEALAMTAIGILALTLGRDGDFSQAIPILGGLALGANRLLPALQHSFSSLAKIQGARASLRKTLIGLKRPISSFQLWIPDTGIMLENEMRFEDVWFRYNADTDWVLRELNLTIKAQSMIGFVGSTGSGKSTTVDIILGLLQPQKGRIWLDHQTLQGEILRRWQQSIAHVPQDIFLADTTIAENIAFGTPSDQANLAYIREAAKLAKIDDFIQTLPARYETYVGEHGVRLSGGQKQRIGIARALYSNASVIILDEATSALDNITEKEVMEAINSISYKLTVILVAHRLTTVSNCDLIFELADGKVINQGTYEELLTKSATFASQTRS